MSATAVATTVTTSAPPYRTRALRSRGEDEAMTAAEFTDHLLDHRAL
jgi:hypothetical protein